MVSIGLMPSDTGMPGGKKTGQNMADYPIIGGTFYNECLKLCTSGFRLNWIDRAYVPAVREHILQITTSGSESIDTEDDALPVSSTVENYLLHATVESIVETTKPEVVSSKQPHICEQCGQKAWGKPTLKLICGVCNLPMN